MADSFQKLQAIPLMIVTPLTFLGGAFSSIDMLSPFWQKVTLFNPVVYLISGMRWAFYSRGDVPVVISIAMTSGLLVVCMTAIWWIFKTGYKLKTQRLDRTGAPGVESTIVRSAHTASHPGPAHLM